MFCQSVVRISPFLVGNDRVFAFRLRGRLRDVTVSSAQIRDRDVKPLPKKGTAFSKIGMSAFDDLLWRR